MAGRGERGKKTELTRQKVVARDGETGDAEAEEAVVYADMAEGLDLKGKDRAASRRTHCHFNAI